MLGEKQVLSFLKPAALIQHYSESEWEEFIDEWVDVLKENKGYSHVQRLGGADDLGRDVVGHCHKQSFLDPWDNYQCKHYNKSLGPSDLMKEIVKHIHHAFLNEFTIARNYYFVAPHNISTKSVNLLGNSVNLKKKVLDEWDKYAGSVSSVKTLPLSPELVKFIEGIDFSVFQCKLVKDILVEHEGSEFHYDRFKKKLPERKDIEVEIEDKMLPYYRDLLDAFEEKLNKSIEAVDELSKADLNLFKKWRQDFFTAESLKAYNRDTFPDESRFLDLQKQVLDGVFEVVYSDYDDGIKRVFDTLKHVTSLELGENELLQVVKVSDKKGICHQLVNDGKMSWANKNKDKK